MILYVKENSSLWDKRVRDQQVSLDNLKFISIAYIRILRVHNFVSTHLLCHDNIKLEQEKSLRNDNPKKLKR